jgi:hypothetical protein
VNCGKPNARHVRGPVHIDKIERSGFGLGIGALLSTVHIALHLWQCCVDVGHGR